MGGAKDPEIFDASGDPVHAARAFEASVERVAGMPLGLAVGGFDERAIYVCNVRHGPFDDYNRSTEEEVLRIRPNDYITQVNGVRGDHERMYKILQEASQLTITIQRPVQFSVAINRQSRPIGMELSCKKGADALFV